MINGRKAVERSERSHSLTDYESLTDALQNGDVDWIKRSIWACTHKRRISIEIAAKLDEEARAQKKLVRSAATRAAMRKLSPAAREQRSIKIRAYYTNLTPDQRAARGAKITASLQARFAAMTPEQRKLAFVGNTVCTPEQRSARVVAQWASMTPEARADRIARIGAGKKAAWARAKAEKAERALVVVIKPIHEREVTEVRPIALTDRQRRGIVEAVEDETMPIGEIAVAYGINERALYRVLHEEEAKGRTIRWRKSCSDSSRQ